MNRTANAIRVLHVDDEPGLSDMVATFLEREDDRITVRTATTADDGLEYLADHDVNCILSDYDMPRTNGLEFLNAVREEYPDLPFILYTGKGSEEIASDAISAGVTDYLQKESGTSQYTVLANRIINVVEQYRSRSELDESRQRLSLFFEQSPLGVIEWDEQFCFTRVNEAAQEILNRSEEELIGKSWESIVPESDVQDVEAVVAELLDAKGGYHSVNENVTGDGERIVCEWHNRVITDDDGDVIAIFSQFQDVTEQQRRQARQKRQREALVELATDDAVAAGSFDTALERITETAAEVLELQRVNVWLLDENEEKTVSRCVDHYDRRSDSHDSGMELVVDDYPDYYEALQTEWAIAADDAREDPRTAGLTEDYLDVHDVGALLDATLRSEGEFIGVVCHEHTGEPREWTEDEIQFAGNVADIVHRALRNRERIEQQREQRFRESLLKAQQEAALDGMLVIDSDREIISYNSQFVDLWGIPGAILETGDDEKALEWAVGQVADSEEFYEHTKYLYEHPEETSRDEIELADGRTFERYSAPVTGEDGTYYGRLWTFRDITQQKERQREREAAQRQFDAVFDTPVAFMALLEPDGTVTNVNETALDFVEQSIEDIRGERFWETPWWDHSERLQRDLRSWIAQVAGGDVVRFEADHYAPDGQQVTIDGVLHPIRDEDGAVVSLLAAGRNISEQKAYERQLERQNDRLENFASVVSHDLRNPLNVIEGRLELAREECNSDHLDHIGDATDRMYRLIEDVLWLAREGRDLGETGAVDLQDPVEAAWKIVADNRDAADLLFDTSDFDNRAPIQSDEDRLQQLLENLFQNAIDHGGPDVTVLVEGAETGFAIADDGPGIPQEERHRVFDPGHSSSEDGTGLGLWIVEQIADAHGWEVRVTDSKLGGARFEITGVGPSLE